MGFLVARFSKNSPPAGLHWCKVPCDVEILIAPFCSRGTKSLEVGKENKKREALKRTALEYLRMVERLKQANILVKTSAIMDHQENNRTDVGLAVKLLMRGG